MTHTKPGFRFIAIIIATLALIALSAGGYYLYTTHKPAKQPSTTYTATSTPTKNQTDDTPDTNPDPNAGYVVIKGWGVRFKPVRGLEGVEYVQWNTQQAAFTTEQLKNSGYKCSAEDNGYSSLGILYRKTANDSSAVYAQSVVGTINGLTYYYEGPQSTCVTNGADTKTEHIFEQDEQLLIQSLKSLELAK